MKTLAITLATLTLSVSPVLGETVTGRVQVVGRPARALVDTIVYAEPVGGSPPQSGVFKVSQRGKTFLPHVVAVPIGATVEFPNDDLFFHNVFSMSRPQPFDLGLYRAGSSQSRTFTAPGTYRVFCNIHPQMSALVLVLPTPHIVRVNRAGDFRLELPGGRYRVTAWSERAVPATTEITVGGGPLTVPALTLDESKFVASPHLNKFGRRYAAVAYDPARDRKPR